MTSRRPAAPKAGRVPASTDPVARLYVDVALPHLDHIHRYRPGVYTVVSAAPGQISHAGTGNHRLGGCAAFINAGTTYMYPLNNGSFPSGLR